MHCRECGGDSDENPSIAVINEAVDEILETSLTDARERGGVCPLCGHSQELPFYHRPGFKRLLTASILALQVVIIAIWYSQTPIRSSLAQEMIARAEGNVGVQKALGTPLWSGVLASGRIFTDETGWSEAKLDIPLHGLKGSGTLRIVAGRGEGPWVVSTLEVWVEGQQEPIRLLRGKTELAGERGYLSVHTQPAVAPTIVGYITPPPSNNGEWAVARIPLGSGDMSPFSLGQRVTRFLNPAESVAEVALASGVFILRRTDLSVADSIPLTFTRVFHTWGAPLGEGNGNWAFRPGPSHPAFGAGSSHTYDICPMGTRNPYTEMGLYTADGSQVYFPRISQGTGYADAVYEHSFTATEFYKSRLSWNGDGWTLHQEDGTEYLFPESYNGKNLAQGSPYEMHNSKGDRVQMIRDADRNLRQLISSSGRSIRIEYNDKGLIRTAQDDAGKVVAYEYDLGSRLVKVIENGQPVAVYRYESPMQDKMTAIEDGKGNVLLTNRYDEQGRVSEQILSGGRRYGYRYESDLSARSIKTVVTGPDGKQSESVYRW